MIIKELLSNKMEMEVGNTKMQRVGSFKNKEYRAYKTNIPQTLVRFLMLKGDKARRIKWYINRTTHRVSLEFIDTDIEKSDDKNEYIGIEKSSGKNE